MRAVIDIGTNSVLMIVGVRDSDGQAKLVEDEATITRLGEGVGASGRLLPAAIERTVAVLAKYRELALRHGAEIEAVATEGLRMASNRSEFLDAAASALGQPVRMISGDEEARLSYLSVAREVPAGPLRVLDIGGGSTELVAGDGEDIESQRSHPIGSVRLTERHEESIDAIADAAREAFAAQPLAHHSVMHGLAGTVTTAAALMNGLQEYDRSRVDGSRFDIEEIRSLRGELAAEPLAVRSARPCLPPKRADVIIAGLTILIEALTHCGASTLVVRDLGLRYALL